MSAEDHREPFSSTIPTMVERSEAGTTIKNPMIAALAYTGRLSHGPRGSTGSFSMFLLGV